MKDYGTNDFGHRSFLITVAALAFSYLVRDPAEENGATYGLSAGDGCGVIQQDAVLGEVYSLIQAGNTLVRKAVGSIAKGSILTTSATPGALRTAKPGERGVAVAMGAALSADAYVPCTLLPGGGALIVPRTEIISVTGSDADAKLFVVPAGYRLDALIAKNETVNAVTIKVGKTSGSQTIVAPVAVGASDLKDCTLLLHTFSFTADQDVFISSADWNGASVTVQAVLTYIL